MQVKANAGLATVRRELRIIDDWKAQKKECAKEMYTLHGAGYNGHLALVATPSDALSACRGFAFHLTTDFGKTAYSTPRNSASLLVTWLTENDHASYALGERRFEDVASAFDTADAGTSERYDLIKNNCASLVLGMMAKLKIPFDDKIENAVVEYLSGFDWFTSGVAKDSFFGRLRGSKDRKIKSYVHSYVKDHYKTN